MEVLTDIIDKQQKCYVTSIYSEGYVYLRNKVCLQ